MPFRHPHLHPAELHVPSRSERYPPPKKKKHYRQPFLFVEFISLGSPEKSVTWLMVTRMAGNIGNAITENISGLQKGPAERGHVKKRQKSSKSVKKFFDNFRAGQKTSKIDKKCQNVFRHFSRGTIFPAPFGGL